MKKILLPICLVFLLASSASGEDEQILPIADDAQAFLNPFVPALPKPAVVEPVAVDSPIAIVEPQEQFIAQPMMELPNLLINGLIWNTNRPQAIVNNKIVGLGDTVDGVEIVAIDRSGIEIVFQQRHYEVGPDSSPKEIIKEQLF
ncbi:MAG: hypothetical protein WC676_06320 [Candidatus Omnitrophota bacterium]